MLQPPEQDHSTFDFAGVYKLQANCTGELCSAARQSPSTGRPQYHATTAVCKRHDAISALLPPTTYCHSAVNATALSPSSSPTTAATRYLSARPCFSGDCRLSIQRSPVHRRSRDTPQLHFQLRHITASGAAVASGGPLFGAPVQLVSPLREATPGCTARLGLDSTAVEVGAELGSEPLCGRWAVGMQDGPSAEAHQWVLEPAGGDMVRLRAQVGPGRAMRCAAAAYRSNGCLPPPCPAPWADCQSWLLPAGAAGRVCPLPGRGCGVRRRHGAPAV